MVREIKADLHNHLKTGSYMPEGIFDRVVDIIRERLGMGGVIGVVNFADHRYEDFSELRGYERQDLRNGLYIPKKDVMVVKGQEVPTKQGHLLVLGVQKGMHLKAGRSLEDSIKEARDNNGITMADHPFYKDGIGPYLQKHPTLFCELDTIEVHNGEAALWIPGFTPRKANELAEDFYFRLGLNEKEIGAISTSDGHSLYEIGESYTELTMPGYSEIETAEKLVYSLRNAVRDARPKDCMRKNSRIGALDHFVDLALIVGLSKLGINLGED